MSQAFDEGWGEAPTVEVRIFRDGELVHRQLCESVDEAAEVVDQWSEQEEITFEVDDLSARHRQGEILEPELAEGAAEEYREQAEVEARSEQEY